MKLPASVRRSFWTIADQGVVSAGSFLVNVLLARQLPAADYGVFSLLSTGFMTLQLFNGSLLTYPLSIRLVTATEQDYPPLLTATLILVASLTVVLSSILAGALLFFGDARLLGPALTCFFFWQLQEATRRGLFSRFRHHAAAVGDALSYLGQVVVMIGLWALQILTIETAFYAMAATSAVAIVCQGLQLDLKPQRPLDLRQALLSCWHGGGVQALATGLLSQARIALLQWVLAIVSGPVAVASMQAVFNIINISNPIMIGLGNVVPQAAAEAAKDGYSQAWRVSRSYLFLAIPIILGYSLILLIDPGLVLRLLYGSNSTYLGLGTPVRLLVIANILNFTCELIVWFFLGVKLVRYTVILNCFGFVTSLLLMPLLISLFGLLGGCAALISANGARFIFGRIVLSRLLNEPRHRQATGHVHVG